MEIVLVHPEIPPNTGNVMRLAANTGVRLHLVEPLGFDLGEAKLRRAGLDYREWAEVLVHPDLDTCLGVIGGGRLIATSGRGELGHHEVAYTDDDVLLFGSESVGLADEVIERADLVVRIPMQPRSRSLNLANSVSVVLYEALRQQGFPGMT